TIIMPVLKERHLLDKPFGQVVFNTAILGDIAPLLGLSILVALRETGSAIQSLWVGVLLGVGGLVYLAGRRFSVFNWLEGLAHGTTQITVRAAFALMFVFLALAESVGVEAILGAFVAGLLLSALAGPQREEITHKLDALGFGFLIPVFFFMVGIEFDLSSLLHDRQALMLVPLLLGGQVVVKALPAALLALWFPLRQTLAGMLLLTTQMSVTIAASSIALKVGAYGSSVHAAVVLAAILSAVLGPVAFARVIGEPEPEPVRQGFVLAGMNRLSLLLGERLAGRGEPVCAIDRHPDRAAEFEQAGLRTVVDDPASPEALRRAGGDSAAVLIAITQDERANLDAARAGHEACGIPRAILFARSPGITAESRTKGFSVINPDLAEVNLVETLLHSPGAVELLTPGDDDLKLGDVLLLGGPLEGSALRDAELPSRVLVVSVGRGEERIVPHGNTILQHGDRLTVVGPPEAIALLRRTCEDR
ncbi:MAG TPA: cation:proton antiporter, partial [Symbiobacteriaceae bacterium]|nr:cation:proton antiporter [Symbiobacteriaceae bacterium]